MHLTSERRLRVHRPARWNQNVIAFDQRDHEVSRKPCRCLKSSIGSGSRLTADRHVDFRHDPRTRPIGSVFAADDGREGERADREQGHPPEFRGVEPPEREGEARDEFCDEKRGRPPGTYGRPPRSRHRPELLPRPRPRSRGSYQISNARAAWDLRWQVAQDRPPRGREIEAVPRDEAERLRRDDIGPQVKEPTCSGDLRKPVTEGRSKTVDRWARTRRGSQAPATGRRRPGVRNTCPTRTGDSVAAANAKAPMASAANATGVQAAMALSVMPTTSKAARRPTFAHRERAEGGPDQNHEADDGALTASCRASWNRPRAWLPMSPGRGGPGRERGRHEAQGKEVEVGSPGALGQQRDGKADQDDRAGFLDPNAARHRSETVSR